MNCGAYHEQVGVWAGEGDAAGGGIACESGSHPVIRDCVISYNLAKGSSNAVEAVSNAYGGGIACSLDSAAVIVNCEISGNTSYGGRGTSDASFANWGCDSYGGGICDSAGSTIKNCLIANNRTMVIQGEDYDGINYGKSRGAGIAGATGTIISNCTIVGNYSDPYVAQGEGGGVYGQATVIDSIVWGNNSSTELSLVTSVSYSDIEGGWTGAGNIIADPLFVSGPGGGYYLSHAATGQAVDSSCIDAGSDTAVNVGLDGLTTRIDEAVDVGTVDMGYHYPDLPAAQPDIDGDGDVDVVDYSVLATEWGKTFGWLADMAPAGGDHVVDVCDLEVLTANWLAGADMNAPAPDPLTWSSVPSASTNSNVITMTASDATDPSGVEYYFECTAGGGHDSGWQDSTTYNDTGLMPDAEYSYRVKARDKSQAQNETGWSSEESASTTCVVVLLEDGFETDFSKWTDGGATDWNRSSVRHHSGVYSARAMDNDNDLISDNLDTTSLACITITFWYRDHLIDDDDDIYLQLYDGSSYVNRFELGITEPEDTWHQAVINITNYGSDAAYFIPNFRIKFEATSLDEGASEYEMLYIDDVLVSGKSYIEDDVTPPSPDPMTWASAPRPSSTVSVTMVATEASDWYGVEYYFQCTAGGGHDSGWQDNAAYEDAGLTPDSEYTYRVMARDKSPNQNETGWSAEALCTTPSTGLPVAHWMLDDGDGGTAVDSTGHHDGILYGNPQWVSGEVGTGALEFDGDDYVRTTYEGGPGEYTISLWYNLNEDIDTSTFSGYRTLVSRTGDEVSNVDMWTIWFANTAGLGVVNEKAAGSYASVYYKPAVFAAGQWHHVVVTGTASEGKIYFDGEPKGTANDNFVTGTWNDSVPFDIGRAYLGTAGRFFNGEIDDVRIYDRVLSDAEILQLNREAVGWCEAIFVSKMPDTDSSAFVTVSADDDVTMTMEFDNAGASEPVVRIVLPAASSFTLEQVRAMINAESQTMSSYDMACIVDNGDATYSLKVESKRLTDNVTIIVYSDSGDTGDITFGGGGRVISNILQAGTALISETDYYSAIRLGD